MNSHKHNADKRSAVRSFGLYGALCGALLLGSTVPAAAQPIAVARVGQQDISVEQVRSLLPDLSPSQREQLGRDIPTLKQAVQAALLQSMLVQAAERAQWDQNPQAVRQMQRAANAALAEGFLAAVTSLPENYPQPAQVEAFYEANKAQLMQPRQMQLSQIFIAEPEQASAEEQKQAAQKRKSVTSALGRRPDGKSFAEAARRFSDEQASAQAGGEIGWLPQEQIVPGLRQALEGVKAGQIVGPVRLEGGWHWIYCQDIREAEPVALERVSHALAERMRAERIQASRQAYLARLLQENPIAINELALLQLLRSDAPASGQPAQEGPAPRVSFSDRQ